MAHKLISIAGCASILFSFGSYLLIGVEAQAKIAPGDRIHQGDLIEIDEIGGFEYDWRGRLNPEGFLDGLTKVAEPIFARCKTTTELSDAVIREYTKVLRAPKVTIRILDRSDRALAYLEGAIKQPQKLRIKRDVYLNELIIIGGGFTDKTSGEIRVFRPENVSCEANETGGPKVTNLKVSDILAGKPASNPKIVSGDIVTILSVQPVYVIGGVNSPGKAAWRDGLTVARAVAAAGGVSGRGVEGPATIYRRDGASNRSIEIDLGKISNGTAADEPLKPYDIIDVPMKGASKRLLPPVIEDPDSRPTQSQSMPLRIID